MKLGKTFDGFRTAQGLRKQTGIRLILLLLHSSLQRECWSLGCVLQEETTTQDFRTLKAETWLRAFIKPVLTTCTWKYLWLGLAWAWASGRCIGEPKSLIPHSPRDQNQNLCHPCACWNTRFGVDIGNT